LIEQSGSLGNGDIWLWCEVQCIPQQMHELRSFPVPDRHNEGPAMGEIGRVDSPRVSQLKLRGKATEPAQNPLIQIMIGVQSCKRR
jgi:hypothetical protein